MIPLSTSIATGLTLDIVNYAIINAEEREFKDLTIELLFRTLFSSLILFV